MPNAKNTDKRKPKKEVPEELKSAINRAATAVYERINPEQMGFILVLMDRDDAMAFASSFGEEGMYAIMEELCERRRSRNSS